MIKSIIRTFHISLSVLLSVLSTPIVFADDHNILKNPLKADDLTDLLRAVLDGLLVLVVPIIVFFIIYAGFQYVVAQGSEEKIRKANTMLLWSIIGGLIILGANVIFDVIQGTINSFEN